QGGGDGSGQAADQPSDVEESHPCGQPAPRFENSPCSAVYASRRSANSFGRLSAGGCPPSISSGVTPSRSRAMRRRKRAGNSRSSRHIRTRVDIVVEESDVVVVPLPRLLAVARVRPGSRRAPPQGRGSWARRERAVARPPGRRPAGAVKPPN